MLIFQKECDHDCQLRVAVRLFAVNLIEMIWCQSFLHESRRLHLPKVKVSQKIFFKFLLQCHQGFFPGLIELFDIVVVPQQKSLDASRLKVRSLSIEDVVVPTVLRSCGERHKEGRHSIQWAHRSPLPRVTVSVSTHLVNDLRRTNKTPSQRDREGKRHFVCQHQASNAFSGKVADSDP